jgi:methyl-accepting chemotaxis protein
MDEQRDAGVRLAEEAGLLAKEVSKAREETIHQAEYSRRVSANMSDLTEAVRDTGEAASEIAGRNELLAKEAEALQDLARRARDTADGLNSLMKQ